MQTGFLAEFVKRLDNHQVGARPRGQEPPPEQEPTLHIRGVINTIVEGFSYGG